MKSMIQQIRTKMDDEKFTLLKLSIALVSMFTAIFLSNPSGFVITCAIASATFFLDYLEAADKFNPLNIRENIVRFFLYAIACAALFSAFSLFFLSPYVSELCDAEGYFSFNEKYLFFGEIHIPFIAVSIGAITLVFAFSIFLLIIPKLREHLSNSKYSINKKVRRVISRMQSRS